MWFLTLKITWLNWRVSLDELFTSKSAGQERLELTQRRAPSPGRPVCESLFPGVSPPRYMSATIFIFVIWNLEISPGCMSYFFSHRGGEKAWERNLPFFFLIQDTSCSFYLWVVLFYLCHRWKNLLGPVIVRHTEVVGFLSLYPEHGYWFFLDNV